MLFISKEKLAEIERKFFSLAYRGTVEELSQFLDTEDKFCINACTPRETGRITALHYAVLSRNLEKIKLLIKHGSDVNALNVNGLTPIRMLFKINKSVETSKENMDAIWDCLIYYGAHIPSYNDLDSNEREVIYNNMAVYRLILLIMIAIHQRRLQP